MALQRSVTSGTPAPGPCVVAGLDLQLRDMLRHLDQPHHHRRTRTITRLCAAPIDVWHTEPDRARVLGASPSEARQALLLARSAVLALMHLIDEGPSPDGSMVPVSDIFLLEATPTRLRILFELKPTWFPSPPKPPSERPPPGILFKPEFDIEELRASHWPMGPTGASTVVIIEVDLGQAPRVLTVPVRLATRYGRPFQWMPMSLYGPFGMRGMLLPHDYALPDTLAVRSEDDTSLRQEVSLERPVIVLERQERLRELSPAARETRSNATWPLEARVQARLALRLVTLGWRAQGLPQHATLARLVEARWLLARLDNYLNVPRVVLHMYLQTGQGRARGGRDDGGGHGSHAAGACDILQVNGQYLNGPWEVSAPASGHCSHWLASPAIAIPAGEQVLWFDLRPRAGERLAADVFAWLEALPTLATTVLPDTLMCITVDPLGIVREYACEVPLEIRSAPQASDADDRSRAIAGALKDLASTVDVWTDDASARLLREGATSLRTREVALDLDAG